MNKQKIIITGSAGFIFSNFIRKAIYDKQPYSFVSIDRVNNNTINSMYCNKNHLFYVADITDQHIIDTIFKFEKPDIVIHAAAETNIDSNPNSFITSNVLGTQVVINCCEKHNVKKFLYISSDGVYGQLNNEQDPSWTEDSLLNPRTLYSVSKMSAESLVKISNLNYNIIRLSNNYGPRQTNNRLIPKVIKSIINNLPIEVYGQGLQVRDWIHVFDTCSAIFTVLEKGVAGEIYNVSAKQEFSNIEVVQKICNIMNSGHNLINCVPDPRRIHDFRYSMNCDKIKSLGYKPQIKFNEGIALCCQWYATNKWWLQ